MDTMTIVRVVITVTSFVCFISWLIWFLRKDNHGYYQARAIDLLNDDDTTPTTISTTNTTAQPKEAK